MYNLCFDVLMIDKDNLKLFFSHLARKSRQLDHKRVVSFKMGPRFGSENRVWWDDRGRGDGWEGVHCQEQWVKTLAGTFRDPVLGGHLSRVELRRRMWRTLERRKRSDNTSTSKPSLIKETFWLLFSSLVSLFFFSDFMVKCMHVAICVV